MDAAPSAAEPSHWFLVFSETTTLPWLNRVPFLRFRHVSAFGYIAGFRAWLFFDVHWLGVSLYLVSHETARAEIGRLIGDATVVRLPAKRATVPLMGRLGFYCVPAARHLVGLRCVCLTPDGLYRSAIRRGGEIILGLAESSPTAGRPAADPRTAAGAGRSRQCDDRQDAGRHGEPDGALWDAPCARGQ